MGAIKLVVKKEYLDNQISFQGPGGAVNVVLKNATQRDLELLKETNKGELDYIFEAPVKEK